MMQTLADPVLVCRALSIPYLSGQSIKIWPKLREVGWTLQNDGRCVNENGGSQAPDCVLGAVWRIVLKVMHTVLNIHPLPILSAVPLILCIRVTLDC